jgi:hypothetical protein
MKLKFASIWKKRPEPPSSRSAKTTMRENRYFIGPVSRDPLIFRFFWYNQDLQEIKLISNLVEHESAVFLVSNGWSLVDRYRQGTLLPMIERLKNDLSDRPHHRLIMLGNDTTEANLCNALGVQGVSSNHNIWLDNNVFKITDAEKRYDSVYNTQLIAHKRCELVENIRNVCFITASSRADYVAKIWRNISHVQFVNGSPLGNPRRLPPAQVSEILNQSMVGLCLSWVEGAMFSAGEYLLCGLPIVSTYSIGGRDVLFDKYNSILVPAEPQSVADAVARLVESRRNPYRIRADVLSRMWRLRSDLYKKVVSIMGDDWNARQRFQIERIFLDPNATLEANPRSMEEIADFLRTDQGRN